MLRGNMERLLENNEAYLAMAMYAYGLFDAMLFDHNDYDGYAYLNFIKNLRFGASTGFYPQGCHIPESVAYHELGHLRDKLCNLNKNEARCPMLRPGLGENKRAACKKTKHFWK